MIWIIIASKQDFISLNMRASIITATAIIGGAFALPANPSSTASVTVTESTPTQAAEHATSIAAEEEATTPSSCPTDLNGDYQFPHLIVPVSKSEPDKAFGTQYNGTIDSDKSTIYNFDIPAAYQGKSCSAIFLFPKQADLRTSAYDFNNKGGLDLHALESAAKQDTTYANQPPAVSVDGSIPALAPGTSYVLATQPCPAGQRKGFMLSATGELALQYFQDYDVPAIGLYIRAC